MASALAKATILSLVLASALVGNRAFAQVQDRPGPVSNAHATLMRVSQAKHHKHHNRNFYGKHYDPWAHSRGSH
jgi:hypothetical protein